MSAPRCCCLTLANTVAAASLAVEPVITWRNKRDLTCKRILHRLASYHAAAGHLGSCHMLLSGLLRVHISRSAAA